MKHIIYCISLIIVVIFAFILGKMQVNDKPAMIGLKTDGIVIKDGIWICIDSVDRDRSPEGCVLETIGLREDSEGRQGR